MQVVLERLLEDGGGDAGRCRKMKGGAGRCREMQGDAGSMLQVLLLDCEGGALHHLAHLEIEARYRGDTGEIEAR